MNSLIANAPPHPCDILLEQIFITSAGIKGKY